MEIVAGPKTASVGAFPSSCQVIKPLGFPPEKVDELVGEVI